MQHLYTLKSHSFLSLLRDFAKPRGFTNLNPYPANVENMVSF